jgi:CheY-like chemotaxis protein
MVILYADDDDDDREVFAEILQALDPSIRLVQARDGLETIDKLAKLAAPDVIFLDVNMPGLNGYETLAEIRKDFRLKDIKVIMYSTTVNQKTFEDNSDLHAEYLRKPNNFHEGIFNLGLILGKRSTQPS